MRPVYAALVGVALVAALPASATVLRRMEIEALARASGAVAVARVESVRAAWEPDRASIRTRVTLTRERALAGDVPRTIRVSVLGGTVDGISATYDAGAAFREGDRVVVFLERRRGHADEWLVTGAFQGAFRLETEAETGMEVAVRESVRKGVAIAGASGDEEPLRLYLDELVARVREARTP